MGIFEKNKQTKEQQLEQQKEQHEESMGIMLQLQKNNELLLEKVESLQTAIDGIDKNNRKALLMSAANDDRVERLENKIIDMKKGIIGLLDQIDVLVSSVESCEDEYLKQGLRIYNNKVAKIAEDLELEVLNVETNMKFDPKEMDCKEYVCIEEYEEEVVVEVLNKGYRDIVTGNILRYAIVICNKKNINSELLN